MDYIRYIEQEDLNEISEEFNVEETITYLVSIVAMKIKRRLNQVLKDSKVDLTPEQFFILGSLKWHGAMSLSELASKSHKDNANITRMVDLIEKKQLVNRTRDDEDKRTTKLVLTKEGESSYGEALKTIADAKRVLLPGLDGEELEKYKVLSMKLLKSMIENPVKK